MAALALLLAAGCDGGGPTGGTGGDADGGAPDTRDGDAAGALAVESVQPATGPVSGGTNVTVVGAGFEQGATVRFGDSEAPSASFQSATRLEAATPSADAPGTMDVTVANPDGETATLAGGFEYTEGGGGDAEVGWCTLQHPPTLTATVGTETEPVFGRVFVEGCTSGDAQCEAVTGQLGLGTPGSDPTQAPGDWSWSDASYNPEHTSDDNDEYRATRMPETQGTFAYAYRFSVDGGESWTYCDLDGSDNGFSAEQTGMLTVEPEDAGPPEVGWCRLQHPPELTATVGTETEPVFGRVFVEGCTGGDEACEPLTAELGRGPTEADPSSEPGAWSWSAGSRNADATGVAADNSEYEGTLTPESEGTFAYAYRFSVDGGESWTYCDLDGSGNDFALEQTGTLEVSPEGVEVGWCNLQHPPSTAGPPGIATETLYGRLHVPGCTGGDEPCEEVTAEVGHGDPDTDPSSEPSAYTWVEAAPNPEHTGDANDEYQAAITPSETGTHAYVYRFSGDGGESWTYCDLDGNAGDAEEAFEPAQMGELTVETVPVGWCNLQHPASTETAAGEPTEPIFGRVFSAGCTDGDAECPYLVGEVGYGPEDAAPSSEPGSFEWVRASYNAAHTSDDNDEHQATLAPATAGSYGYAYRFSGDGGASWTYCDLNGNAGTDEQPFQPSELGTLNVSP